MRRLAAWSLALAIATTGCNRQPKVETIEEKAPAAGSSGPSNLVHTADPATEAQLVSGFYPVEQNAWRWTMGRFTVSLKTPPDAREKGATLTFRFGIHESILTKTPKLTLKVRVNGKELPSQTYTKPGDQTYAQDVPSDALSAATVTAEFVLDPILPAGTLETRELGVVASSFALETK